MKTKKNPGSSWKKTVLEILRYLFFAAYVLLLAAVLYGASSLFPRTASFQTAGGPR